MSFKDQVKTDFYNIFLNTNEFAEEITYTPSGGVPKTINAVVIRQRLDPQDLGGGRTLTNQVELYISRDATQGIASVDKGDDEVSLPEIPGGSSISWAIIDIIEGTEAMWHLLAEK